MLFKIDADYDTVEWYGNGPAETYWDRQHGAKLGIYQNKVADNMAQYLVPQECGAMTAVRWAKVVDRKGRGLLFTADAAKPMFFSALPYTPANILEISVKTLEAHIATAVRKLRESLAKEIND